MMVMRVLNLVLVYRDTDVKIFCDQYNQVTLPLVGLVILHAGLS